MKKRVLSFVLVLCLLAACLPLSASAAEIVDSGTCGDNLTWTLDSDGLLTISGTGNMYNYSRAYESSSEQYRTTAPWGTHYQKVTAVVLKAGVTSIGNYAFCGCSSLTSVVIPDSVTSIGKWAFYGCSSLTSVVIPDSITSIGEATFSGCSSLTSVVIPDSVTSIGGWAFSGCSSLTSVTIPDSVTSIGGSAFYGCSSLTSVVLPDSVTSIEDSAFWGCSSLTSVVIPESVTSIGYEAFSGCSSLTSVVLPDSVTSIGYYAFSSSLKDVLFFGTEEQRAAIRIDDSNDSLNNCRWHYAPAGTPIYDVTVEEAEGCTLSASALKAFAGEKVYISATPELGYYIKSFLVDGQPISGSSFVATGNHTVSVQLSTNKKDSTIEASGQCGIEAFWSLTPDGKLVISGAGNLSSYSIWSDFAPWRNYSETISSVIMDEGITSIGGYAFYRCSSLTSVVIPDSVTSIGNYAFLDCSSLTSVTIPDSVTSIGDGAFEYCSSLTSVVIPDSVTSIGNYAFRDCSKLTVRLGASVKEIGSKAFDGCLNVSMDSANPHFVVEECALYDKAKTKLLQYWSHPSRVILAIPEGVKGIETGAISSDYLWALGIPQSMWRIMENAISMDFWNVYPLYYSGSEEEWAGVSIGKGNAVDAVMYDAPLHWSDEPLALQADRAINAGSDVTFSIPASAGDRCFLVAFNDKLEMGLSNGTASTGVGIPSPLVDGDIYALRISSSGEIRRSNVIHIAAPLTEFSDVKPGAYYEKAVAWAVAKEITNGTGANTFGPSQVCKRGQVVTFLWRAAGQPEPQSLENPFTDVKEGAFYYKAVLWAVEQGITSGTSKTTFSPDAACERCQVATFLWRAAKQPEPKSLVNPFTDVKEGYYHKAVLWAVEQGITNGTSKTTFGPNNPCLREHVVTFLWRAEGQP